MKYHFNYIITIHNKQDLIREVLLGVINTSTSTNNSNIYPVLDGCTDDTEKIINSIINEYPDRNITKLYAPDVHEIKSLNIALRSIPQDDNVLNICLQDDVILFGNNLEEKVSALYEQFGFNNVGTLTFRHGATIVLDHKNKRVAEKDITESVYGIGMTNQPIPKDMVVEKMIGVRSPECISSHVIKNIGYLDEALAPYTWDNHDLSLRCLKANLRNFVFAIPFSSEVKWGGTRTNPHPEYSRIMERNQQILYTKHKEFIESFSKTIKYSELRIAKPFYLNTINHTKDTEDSELLKNYNERRNLIISNPYQRIQIDVIKKNLRSFIYFLIFLKIYVYKIIYNQ